MIIWKKGVRINVIIRNEETGQEVERKGTLISDVIAGAGYAEVQFDYLEGRTSSILFHYDPAQNPPAGEADGNSTLPAVDGEG